MMSGYEIRGGPVLQKFFSALSFEPQFNPKLRGRRAPRAPPLDPPLVAMDCKDHQQPDMYETDQIMKVMKKVTLK